MKKTARRGRRLSRRRFLQLGLGGAVLLGAGGLLSRCVAGGYTLSAHVQAGLRTLSTKEAVVLGAIAARLLRPDATDLPAPEELDTTLYLDGFVGRLDPVDAAELKKLLAAVEHLAPLAAGHATRFSRLAGPEQDEVLRALMLSSVALFRGGFQALQTLCVMAYFRHPATWTAIGYDGPLVGRPPGGWPARRGGPPA